MSLRSVVFPFNVLVPKESEIVCPKGEHVFLALIEWHHTSISNLGDTICVPLPSLTSVMTWRLSNMLVLFIGIYVFVEKATSS